MSCQIKIAVVCEVAGGILVADRFVSDGQGRPLQRIGHLHLEMTGIALFPIGAVQRQDGPLFGQFLHRPNPMGEACISTVEVVRAVVHRQLILLTTQGKFSFCNPVGEAAHHRAQVAAFRLILLQGVVAQHYVHRALPARDRKAAHHRAEGQNIAGHHPVVQRQFLHFFSLVCGAKGYSILCH